MIKDFAKNRIDLLKLAWSLAIMVILGRLFMVQILQHNKWVEAAEKQHVMQNTILAERGKIFMMDEGKPVPVVMNQAVWTVAVDPKVAKEEKIKKAFEKIAKDYIVAKWTDVFADKNRRYFVVAKDVPLGVAEKIRQEELVGVFMKKDVKRVYTEGKMASGMLGFVNNDGLGQYGVEWALNKELAGKNGLLKTVKDINNTPLTIGNDNVRVPAINGKNVVLTVDRNIQTKVEKILTGAVEKNRAEKASAIVMNPNDGRILAIANVPNYDPRNFGKVKDASAYLNRVTEDPYEPASVCKAFAFAAGIEEGVLMPETRYHNAGKVMIDGWPIENAYKGMLGDITIQDALNYSLNTGSIEALRLMGGGELNLTGRQKLFDYYVNKFGLGRATGVELNEALGLVNAPDNGFGRNSLYANMTFGQNMNVTMMQVMKGFAALINGGERVQPSIIAHIGEKVNREVEQKAKKVEKTRVISEKTSEIMRNMLFVTRRGARIRGVDKPGYFVGGKTGTAQVIRDGRYTLNETVATYIGFGGKVMKGDRNAIGLEKERLVDGLPEYLVMVRIEGKGLQLGGEAHALPIFDEISNYLQDYLRIQPS